MKSNKIDVFTIGCPTPYKVSVSAGAGTPTVIADSPAKADNLSHTYRVGIMMAYRRYLGLSDLDVNDLKIKDYAGGDCYA